MDVFGRLLVQKVIDAVFEEAALRCTEVDVADITIRLFSALERGVQDQEELKDAVLFNNAKIYRH